MADTGVLGGPLQALILRNLLQQDRERSRREFHEWRDQDRERSEHDVERIVNQHQEWLRQHNNNNNIIIIWVIMFFMFNMFNIWVITLFFTIFVVFMLSLH